MRHFKIRLSLRYKLLLLLVSLPLLSLGLYLFIATDLFQKDKVAYVYDSSATVSRSIATQSRMEIRGTYDTFRAIVENFDFAANDFNIAGREHFEKNPRTQAIVLLRRESTGQYVKMGQMAKDTPFAQEFISNEAMIGELRQAAVTSTAFISEVPGTRGLSKLAFRLGERDEQNHMVIVGLNMAEDLTGAFEGGGTYASFMATSAGQVVFGGMSVVENDLALLKNIFATKVNEGTAEVKLADGGTYLVSYSKVGLGDLMVVSRVDKRKALKAVEVLVAKSLLFFVALIASTLLISVFASYRLTSALRELFEATRKVAQGDFTVRVQPRSKDEVGGLAESFNWMAGEVARLLENTAEKVRMEGELATVRTVQDTLFPESHRQFGPLHIKGHFEPASECGGDWWSYSRSDNKIYIYIGDATGHGAPAALITSAARSAAAVIEGLPDMTPAKALSIMNRAIGQTSKGQIMMTFFIASIDLDKNTFTYASASHDPPYLLRKVGEKLTRKDIVPLNEVNGPRLGDQIDFQYQETSIEFRPGDLLFFYTDGVLDIQDAGGKKWGERAFLKSLVDCSNDGLGVEAKIDLIRSQIETYRGGSSLIDDVTMVMCEYEKRAA